MDEPRLTVEELRVHWHLDLVLAYVRGSLPDLTESDPRRMLCTGRESGLDLDPFKRSRVLPRVAAVMAMLQSFGPTSLVDLGTGRGRLLWQVLETMPSVNVVTVDQDPTHVRRIEAMRVGGLDRVRGIVADVEQLPLPDRSADGVTALEILEHAENPEQVAREALRLASRFLIISVPSAHDDNPEHIHLFDVTTLKALLTRAGARRVTVRRVPGHFVALVDARPA